MGLRTSAVVLVFLFASKALSLEQTVEVPIIQNELGLPIISLCNDQTMLIDTGSEEAWLADSSCKNCNKTRSLCPPEVELLKQINYFKGFVKGDEINFQNCFGSHKVLCVKESQNLQNIEAHGILGVKGFSTGKDMMTSFIKSKQVQKNKFSLYYGLNEAKLFLGEVPEKYKSPVFPVSNQNGWYLMTEKLILNQTETPLNCQIHFDTGSTTLILNSVVYSKLFKYIDEFMISQDCFQVSDQLAYKCYQSVIDFNHEIVFELVQVNQIKSSIRLNLQRLVKIRKGTYYFQLKETQKNICVLGLSIFQDYIVEFSLDGSLQLYHSNFKQLSSNQVSNYIIMLLEYVLLIGLLSLGWIKSKGIVQNLVDKKIVI